MNEAVPPQDKQPSAKQKLSASPTDISNNLLQIFKDWWSILAPIAAAITAGLATFGFSNSLGQLLGWGVTLAFVGIAFVLWRRKQREIDEEIDREQRLKEFEKGRAVRASFRGLASFGSDDFLPGPQRRREAGTIFTQVSADAFQFGIISGDSGAGKSSLLRAELAGLLKSAGFAVVFLGSPRQTWSNAGTHSPNIGQVVQIIKDWVDSRFPFEKSPRFLIVDQFEEFFIRFRDTNDRREFGKYLNGLIRGNPSTKVLCAVRRDYFVDFRDLAPDLEEPLSTKNTFLVRNFGRSEAEEVIRECAARDDIEIPSQIPELLANDLAEQDEVRPAELQIVCTALRGDFRLQHYRTAGGATSILSRHIALAVETTRQPALARLVLRSLCDFAGNAKAEAASITALVRRIGPQRDAPAVPEGEVLLILEQFEAERLTVRSKLADRDDHWALIHDYLVGPVKLATQDASTRAEDATHILEGYLAEARSNTSVAIPVSKLREIRRYCPKNVLQTADAKRLLRRSYMLGYGRPASLVMMATLITGCLGAYLGTESIWSPVRELRHWRTANESGRVEFEASEGKVITHNGDVVIWSQSNAAQLARYESQSRDIVVGGKYLVMRIADNKTIRIIDLDTMQIKSVPTALLDRLRFNAGIVDDYLVIDGDTTQIISLKEAAPIFSQAILRSTRRSVRPVLSQDKVVVIMKDARAGEGGSVPGVWSLSTGQFITQLSPLAGPTSWFDISSNGREVVAAQRVDDATLTIQIWDISAPKPKLRTERHFKNRDLFPANAENGDFADITFDYVGGMIYASSWGSSWDSEESPMNFRPTLLRASDLETLETATGERPSGVLISSRRSLVYFSRSDESLVLWDSKTLEFSQLQGFALKSKDRLSLNDEGNILLVSRASSTFEIWNLDTRGKQATISGIRLKGAFFSLDDKSLGSLQEGGSLQLWSLFGQSLGTISGVGGDRVLVNRNNCDAIVWTSEGRVIEFVSGWQILGLFFVPHRHCG
jgi:WD40 repeat protein